MPNPHTQNTSGSSFRQRLGYYLIGVAMGLILLGFLMTNRQNAARTAPNPTPAGETPSPNPTPP